VFSQLCELRFSVLIVEGAHSGVKLLCLTSFPVNGLGYTCSHHGPVAQVDRASDF
jgi:hypothetical protein